MAISPCDNWIDENGRELSKHGTTLFPIAFYNDDLHEEAVPWHWHEELEAGIVVKGTVIMKVDSEQYVLHEGDGFFINSEVLHELWECNEEKGELYSMVFHPRLVGGSVDSIFWQQYLQPLLDNTSLKGMKLEKAIEWHREVITAAANAWSSGAEEPEGYEFDVRNELSKMIFLITSHNKNHMSKISPKTVRDDMRIKKMLQYIKSYYQEEISIEQIAKSAQVSESECLRCFRNTIGTTPIQFLKEYRLQRAAYLLRTGNQKIVDIGIQCGFQDMSYFAKTFRLAYGCTPSEYRDKT